MLKQFALVEYYHMHHTKKDGKRLTIDQLSTQNIQCYCNTLVNEEGRGAATMKMFNYKFHGKEQKEQMICSGYLHDDWWISILGLIVPLMVVIFNAILKNIAIIGFGWVGFENRTLEISKIQNACFVLLFFNTAISILIINTNLQG
jgi:hypothetical protein